MTPVFNKVWQSETDVTDVASVIKSYLLGHLYGHTSSQWMAKVRDINTLYVYLLLHYNFSVSVLEPPVGSAQYS